MKLNNFRGELTDISAKKEPLRHTPALPHCTAHPRTCAVRCGKSPWCGSQEQASCSSGLNSTSISHLTTAPTYQVPITGCPHGTSHGRCDDLIRLRPQLCNRFKCTEHHMCTPYICVVFVTLSIFKIIICMIVTATHPYLWISLL